MSWGESLRCFSGVVRKRGKKRGASPVATIEKRKSLLQEGNSSGPQLKRIRGIEDPKAVHRQVKGQGSLESCEH